MVAKTTRKKKTNKTIKQELLNSLKENANLEEPGLDATGDTITDTFEAVKIIKRYK